jgi:hypothetical protein
MSMRRMTGRGRRSVPLVSSGETVDLTGAFWEGNAAVANVTKDGSNLIGTLNDLSGNARHLTQGTGANKPLWVDNQKGSIDGCQFNTAGALKRVARTGLGALFNHYEWTFAMVTKCDTSPNVNTFGSILNTQNSATGRGGMSVGHFSNNFTRRIQMSRISDAAAGAVSFGTTTAGTWELWVVRLTGTADGSAAATVTTRVNGAGVAAVGTIYTNIVDANGAIFLGTGISSGASSVLWAKGWNRALSDASIIRLETDVNATYLVY